MTIEDLVTLIEAVGDSYPALFLVALIGIFVLLWKFGKDILTALADNTKKTAAVQKQVTNNGGSTMKDAVDRIEKTLNDHLDQAAPINEWATRKMEEEAQEPRENPQTLF